MIDKISGLSGACRAWLVRRYRYGQCCSHAAHAADAVGDVRPRAPFAETMQSLGQGVMNNLKVAEGQSFAAVRGEVPTRDVVDAIMTAEQSLQTASRHP
jgi:flagellar hook-basal body complex protein FliE